MILDITSENIQHLSDIDLRTLVGKLAEEELTAHNCSPSFVTYGGHQNSGDGGIDVRVSIQAQIEISGFVPRLEVGFQVKAQDMPRTAILNEMKISGVLKSSICEIAARGGSYIIVSSKGSLSDSSLKKRKAAMVEAISKDANCDQLRVDFYDRQRLATWVNQHPGLIIWVRNKLNMSLSGWREFGDWSSSPENLNAEFLLDDSIRIHGVRLKDSKPSNSIEAINQIRTILNSPKGSVRLVGLSGVGKTRFGQALFDSRVGNDALSPNQVIYTDLSDNPSPTPQQLFEQIQFKNKRCVFIVDNCSVELHRKLTNAMKSANNQMSLMTIEYDIGDDEPEGSEVFKLEPASNEIIENVIRRHYRNLTNAEIHTISKFSEGNSRVALALANTSQLGDSLANMKDSELFKRLFHQNHSPDQRLYDAAMACSLVYSFDVEKDDGSEAEITLLSNLANQTWEEIYKHVAELKKRQLVQSRSVYRAILPHALAHRLANEALKSFHPSKLRSFISSLPARMLKSFSKRLGALHDSPEARPLVSKWMEDFSQSKAEGKWNDLNMTVLDNLAPVAPENVLNLIESELENFLIFANSESLYEHKIVSLLRAIAYEPEYFDRAQNIIVRLVNDAVPSNNVNAAVNVFGSLFSLYLSGTHATACQRCNYLRKCLRKNESKYDNLTLVGLEKMLQIRHFHSFLSFEFGSRKRDYGYYPNTPREVQEWLREVIKLLAEIVEVPRLKVRTLELVTNNFQQLCEDSGIEGELVEFAKFAHRNLHWNDGWRVVRAVSKSKVRENDKVFIDKFRALEEEFKPQNIEERLGSYILVKNNYDLEYLEEEQNVPDRHSKASSRIVQSCRNIGAEIVRTPDILEEYLPAILASENHRKWDFGFGMGRYCDDPKGVWGLLVSAYKQNPDSVRFNLAGGFLKGLNEINEPLCGEFIDEALNDVDLHRFFVAMQTAVGLEDTSFEKLIDASKQDTVPVESFYNIALGSGTIHISGELLDQLIASLISRKNGFEIALEILNFHFFAKASEKLEITKSDTSTAKRVLMSAVFARNQAHSGYKLAKLVKHNLDTIHDKEIANNLCKKLKCGFDNWSISTYDYYHLLCELCLKFPVVFLDEIFAEATKDKRWFYQEMFRRAREDRQCPLLCIPINTIIEWANQDLENRYLLLAASITPFDSKKENGPIGEGTPWGINQHAIAIIENSPDPKEVIVEMSESIRPRCWSGSRAEIMQSRLVVFKQLAEILPSLTFEIDSAVQEIQKEIDVEREREAQESRSRDEKFEW